MGQYTSCETRAWKKNKIMVIKNNTMYAVYTVVTVHEFGETARVHEFKLYVKFNFSDIALLSTRTLELPRLRTKIKFARKKSSLKANQKSPQK